jgi:O-antigen/teichoic acid export membrane protein
MRLVRDLSRGEGTKATLIRAIVGSGALQFAGMALTFLVGIQLARGLGPAGYGRYGIALAVVTLTGVVGALGVPKLVTREVAASAARNDLPTMFGLLRWANRTCFAASMIAGAVTSLLAAVIWTRSHEVGLAILVAAPMIPLLALASVQAGAMQGLHYVVRGQVPSFLLRPLVFSILLFLLFHLVPHVRSYDAMALNVVTAIISLLVASVWLRKMLPSPRPQAVADNGRAWLRSSVPMAMTDGLQMLQSQLSILLLGALTLPAEVGLFRIALSVWAVTAVPTILVATAVGPTLARFHSQSDERLQKIVTYSAWVQLLCVVLMSIPLFLFPKELLGLVFGQEYVGAAPALLLLLVGQIVNVFFGVNSQLLNMTGNERSLTKATLWGVLVNIVATSALVPSWGALGAAMGTALSILTWNVITWAQARRLLQIDTSVFATTGRR